MNLMKSNKNSCEMFDYLLSVLNSLKQSKNITDSIKRLFVKYYLEDKKEVNINSFVEFYYSSNIYKENIKLSVYNKIKNNPGIELNELIKINKDYKKSVEELVFCNIYLKDNKCYIIE